VKSKEQAVRAVRSLIVAALFGAFLLAPISAPGANRSPEKRLAEPRADAALVYLIREKRFVGGGRTMFVFSDQSFLGTLDNDSYTLAYLPPGKHLLWLNWAKINSEVELEAGKTYYYAIWTTFDSLDESSGKAYLGGISAYATPTEREFAKGAEHIAERYGKAVASAEAKPDDTTKATALRRRAEHVAAWPKIDLAAYPTLCIDPFVMADPKAEEKKQQYLVDSAPQRLAALILEELSPAAAFLTIRSTGPCGNASDTVVLRARITQYKPGSDTARFMIAGAGSAQIELQVQLVSAQTGQTLVELQPKGTWAWGGVVGAAAGISNLEKNVAYEVAAYLRQARGQPLPDLVAD
jgi:hypothetical protein